MNDPLYLTSLTSGGFFELLKPARCVDGRPGWEKLLEKNFPVWLPSYAAELLTISVSNSPQTPAHIMLCLVDHFEPQHGEASEHQAQHRMRTWVSGYPQAMRTFRDADGVMPQHTWFYPPHHDQRYIDDLLRLCAQGFGEIEMHLHHNKMQPFPDTPETLRAKIMNCIDSYSSRGGIFQLPDGRKTFAFIHGDWSLDNSRGPEFCGVNNELGILAECGCYADFTFPSLGAAQPSMINRMYYADDDPCRPKSYNKGREVRAGKPSQSGLMMISGILGMRAKKPGQFGFTVETSNLDVSELPAQERIDYWIQHAVRIPGRPDWLFVKLHTHGAVEENFPALFGDPAIAAFEYLNARYNDKKDYYLHFVSARQMYNIVKAAEAGMSGNPNDYRDFVIPKYVYLK
jgi:hypothetical protein